MASNSFLIYERIMRKQIKQNCPVCGHECDYLQVEEYRCVMDSIKEKAFLIAPDYPNIETCKPWEQLYAIASSYKGTSLANDDLHKLLEVMRLRLEMTKEEMIELSKEVRREGYFD